MGIVSDVNRILQLRKVLAEKGQVLHLTMKNKMVLIVVCLFPQVYPLREKILHCWTKSITRACCLF